MPISDNIRKILFKIQLLIISVLLMKGQSDFVTRYIGPCWAWGLGGTREKALRNFLKFQHCSPVQGLQLLCWLFMTMNFYTKTTLHTATTLPSVTVICFEIWNLIMMVSAINYDEWLKPLSFDVGNQFYLMLCDVINYNDVIYASDSLEFVKDVRFTDV